LNSFETVTKKKKIHCGGLWRAVADGACCLSLVTFGLGHTGMPDHSSVTWTHALMKRSILSVAGKALLTLTTLVVLFSLCWLVVYLPSTPYYIFGSVVLFWTCLASLLTLNFGILVIYINYIIYPSYRRTGTTTHRAQLQAFKPLSFTQTETWAELMQQRRYEKTRIDVLPIASNSVKISESFDRLISFVIRDFVSAWFVRISQSSEEIGFPQAVESAIRSAAATTRDRLEKTDLLDVVVNRIIPKVTAHISDYRIAEMQMRGKTLERSLTQSDELDLLLASQYRGGKLHRALSATAVNTKISEVSHLRRITDRILPFVLPEKDGQSPAVTVLVREIVSCVVLQPICDMISEPDYWNQTINTQVSFRQSSKTHSYQKL
jgi:sorting nexin-25